MQKRIAAVDIFFASGGVGGQRQLTTKMMQSVGIQPSLRFKKGRTNMSRFQTDRYGFETGARKEGFNSANGSSRQPGKTLKEPENAGVSKRMPMAAVGTELAIQMLIERYQITSYEN